MFDDTFFVTGGGTGGELVPEPGAGHSNYDKNLPTANTATSTSPMSTGRPRSTPVALTTDQRKLATTGALVHAAGPAASSAGGLSPLRRDVWTADAGCLGPHRLCFRSQPIHDLVSSTLLSIDPSGVFSMYEEWSNIKNRVLSRKLSSFPLCTFRLLYNATRESNSNRCFCLCLILLRESPVV